MENVKISPPWITFHKEVAELFKKDDDVVPVYDDEKKELSLHVYKYEKAEALKKILPKEKEFGNVKVIINVEYREKYGTIEDAYKVAFENNPAFKYAYTFRAETNFITYVVFAKEVVQYWNDDMSDPHGVTSTLYEDIASDLFENDGVIYSTDSDKNNNWMQKYTKHHATAEEIEEWEYYNGEGSYSDGSSIESKEEPIIVKDEKTFKSIFNRTLTKEEYPF